jgi:uncharacterized GH25 family protein/beta-lactamase regulating signal transducer with metallopeptidase domain
MTPTSLAAWIVNYQALAAAVLLVALLAGLLVRQPARRAALDWATLAGLLALAGLSALPGWPRVALFERPGVVQPLEVLQPTTSTPARETPVSVPRGPALESRPDFEPMPRPQSLPERIAPFRPPVAAPPVAPPPPPAKPWQWSDVATPLMVGYSAGITVVAAWLLWGAVESWRMVRRAAEPTNELLAELAAVSQGKPPRLLVSRDVSAAAALGAWRPTILVTPQLAAAPTEVVRAVLAHEFAHLRHGDLWFLALGRAGLLLLYPQPFYWWLRRRAADAREALADAAAAGSADRTQYAELLVAAARTLSGPPRRGPALAILERPSQLGRRVKLLLDPRGAIELRSSRRWRWVGAATAAAVVLAASLVQVMPAAEGQDESQPAARPGSNFLTYFFAEPSEEGSDLERAGAAVAHARFAPDDSASTSSGNPRTWPKTVRPPRMIAVPGEGYPPGGWSAYRKDQSPYLSERTPGIFFGDVTDDQNRPLAGVRVRYWTPQQEREVTTDSTGRYTFDGVDEAEPLHYLVFTKEGLSPQFSIGPRRGGQIDTTLTDGFYFTGKVRDPQGLAVAGAQVRASFTPTIDGLDVAPVHFDTATDTEGNYKLFVGPEPYDVTVTKPGSQLNLQATTRANGRSTKQLDFQLAEAEAVAPPDDNADRAEVESTRPASRVYRPVEPDATGAITYRAQVVDRDTGMPVEGAKVIVKRIGLTASGGSRTTGESETTTDDVGEFSFTLSPADMAQPRMFLAFEVRQPGYVLQEFGGGELASIRAREQMGLPPEFRKLELAPGEPIFGQVVSPAGQPVAGLAVHYLTMSPDAHGSTEGVRTQSKAMTDAAGRFRFEAVRGGLTRLWVEPVDYAPRTLLLGKRTGDLGRIELQVGKRLTGTLLDVAGQPVPNAWVKVGPKTYPFVERMSGDQSQRTALSDANGRFALGPLAPGEYQASVSGRDWGNPEAPETEAPVPAVFLAQLVKVDADAPTNDVTLRAVPHVRVTAKCVDEAGKPADASRFIPFARLNGRLEGTFHVDYQAWLEDPNTLTVLAPRGLKDAALGLGHLSDGQTFTRRSDDGAWLANRSVSFGTLDHDVSDIFFTYKESPIVVVRAVDPEGKPIATARPRVDYPNGLLGVEGARRWENGIDGQAMLSLQSDGRWRSRGLMPDQTFTLTMQAPGYRSKNQVLELAAGKSEEVTLQLEPAPPGEATIGLVPEPEGEPLFRLEVDFGAMEDEAAGTSVEADAREASEEGAAREPRLVWMEAPMEEEPRAESKPSRDALESVGGRANLGNESVPFAHKLGQATQSIAQPKAPQPYSIKTYEATSVPTKVIGRVIDEHGQPLAGVKVDAWHWIEGDETITDDDGRYELIGFDPLEALEIVFSKEGLAPLLRTDVKAGAVVDVKLDDKTSIVGTIRDAAGQPVKDAVVRASHTGSVGAWPIVPLDLETKTDSEGRYRLLVSRGNFDIWARKPGVGIAQRAFAMALPGAQETIDLQLEPGVRFAARLRDSVTGMPVAGAKLESQFPDVSAMSDADGQVAIDALPQVLIVFEVKAPGYARWWSRQTSSPSDHENPERAGQWHNDTGHLRFELSSSQVSAEIELEPAAKVRGRVFDPNGMPVPDCALAAISGKSYSVVDTRFTTDSAGRFEFFLPASGAVEYFLVGHDGTWHTSGTWANGYANPIRTKPGQTVGEIELWLTRGATIRGQVVDHQGQPLAGKTVVARAKQAGESAIFAPRATTDSEGRFELRNVEAGSNTIMVEGSRSPEDGPPESSRMIDVESGKDQDDIRLIAEPDTIEIDGPFFRTYPASPETEAEATDKAAEAFRPDASPSGDSNVRLLFEPN